ncbi:MAG: chromate transporter [Hespellia sp.]|nr:chromate transporter [Hespellia sp.]
MKKLRELYSCFFGIGVILFGGGLAMLPLLRREVVEKHHWVTEEEVLDIYAIGQCTPGIIAVNTATYIGHKEAGIVGSICATFGMISPSILIICLVASVLQNFIDLPVVQHALAGIRVAVCAMMLETVISTMRKGIVDKLGILLFLVSFVLACFTPVPLALIIVLAAGIGVIAKKREERK